MERINKKVVLILSANPKDTDETNGNDEINAIRDIFNGKKDNNDYHLEVSAAVTVGRIIEELDSRSPYIIHFIGHGTKKGICVEQDGRSVRLLTNTELETIFKNYSSHLNCLVLNSCDSSAQVEVIKKYIPIIISTADELPNDVAIKYSNAFYTTLCKQPFDESSETILDSFNLGCIASDNKNLYTIYNRDEDSETAQETDHNDKPKEPTNVMIDNDIEILRLGRLKAWEDEQIMKNIYTYQHTDVTHFESAMRLASERINDNSVDIVAFVADRNYLEKVLDEVKEQKALARHIHSLIASLTFKG